MSQIPRGSSMVQRHTELEVYQPAFRTAMTIFQLSRRFPVEERYALTDQIRRSSRAVCANIAEAWRRRRYEGSFVLRLNDAEAEAAETQTWLKFASECSYLTAAETQELCQRYDQIIGKLVVMINNSARWTLKGTKASGE